MFVQNSRSGSAAGTQPIAINMWLKRLSTMPGIAKRFFNGSQNVGIHQMVVPFKKLGARRIGNGYGQRRGGGGVYVSRSSGSATGFVDRSNAFGGAQVRVVQHSSNG